MDTDHPDRSHLEARLGSMVAGKYQLVRLLGVGGMGAVYEALNAWTERRVAIKLMLPFRGGHTPALANRFMTEARAATRIAHPNIVDVLDMGQDPADGSLYIVQEFLDGVDLRSLLLEQRGLSLREAFEIVTPVMGALISAHRKSVLHRDIKPDNIFLVRTAHGGVVPKLIDFGIAKVLEAQRPADGAFTRTAGTMGTPYYMSPEQLQGERDVGEQADVWAVGVVLYEVLSGRVPWSSDNYNALIVEILTAPFPRLEAVAPGIPSLVADVIHGALERDRTRRYPTMQAFLGAVLECGAFARDDWHQALRTAHQPGRDSGTPAAPVVLARPLAPLLATRVSGEPARDSSRGSSLPPYVSGGTSTTGRASGELQRAAPARAPRRHLLLGAGIGLGVAGIVVASVLVLTSAHPGTATTGGHDRGTTELPGDAAGVDELLRAGFDLSRRGQHQEAYEAFRRAYERSRRPMARAQMGIAARNIGSWIEAARALNGALSADEDAWVQRNRPQIEAVFAVVEQHVASVDVQSATPGAEVWVNGDRIGSVPLDEPLYMLDATISMEVRAPGYVSLARPVTLVVGRALHERFDLAPARAGG